MTLAPKWSIVWSMSSAESILEGVDRSRGNKYADVAEALLERIDDGVYSVMLPAKRALAEEFDVTPITVAKAIDLLRENGVVRTEQGRGTYITRLKRQRTHTIGVVLHTLSHQAHLHTQLVSAFQDRAHEINENVVAKAHGNDPELELIHVRQLVEQAQVDGVILWPSSDAAQTVDYLKHEGIPFVLVPEPDATRFADCATVSADDAGAAGKVMAHLLASGRTRIGFARGHQQAKSSAMDARYDEYVASMREAGLEALDPILVRDDYTQRQFELAPEQAARIQRLDAVFGATDGHAAAVMSVCLERGIRVPQDMAAAGYDNSDVAMVLRLTSVEQHFERIGRRAVDVLMDDIEERRSEPVHEVVESELVVRRSTGNATQSE